MYDNPIPFNPDTMTVRELKECAETLRSIFGHANRLAALDLPREEADETLLMYVKMALSGHASR